MGVSGIVGIESTLSGIWRVEKPEEGLDSFVSCRIRAAPDSHVNTGRLDLVA